MLRYLTAGESHGKAIAAILEGMPAGLKVSVELIDGELKRRQAGYGRGDRMKIESDSVDVISGIRNGQTIGSPICLFVRNKDASIDHLAQIHSPRPGHADLAGGLKYGRHDMRDILERSSARETAGRVAVGAVCRQFLAEFGIEIISHVKALGGVEAHTAALDFSDIKNLSSKSALMCADESASKLMHEEIDKASADKDTLGGVFEVIIQGHPAGLGSHVHWDRKLDGRLAAAVMSVQAVKGVEIGAGFSLANRRGSKVHDPIAYKNGRFLRKTNNAGGIEGGISNGEPIIIRGVMKPIATLMRPLESVDVVTKQQSKAAVERADVCAVPACGVIAESVCCFEIAAAMLEKFGCDTMAEISRNHADYMKMLERY